MPKFSGIFEHRDLMMSAIRLEKKIEKLTTIWWYFYAFKMISDRLEWLNFFSRDTKKTTKTYVFVWVYLNLIGFMYDI